MWAYALSAGTERALKRRAQVLDRMHAEGFITALELDRIGRQPVTVVKRRSAFGAPHFVTALTQGRFDALQPAPGKVMTLSSDMTTTIALGVGTVCFGAVSATSATWAQSPLCGCQPCAMTKPAGVRRRY